MDWGKKKKKKTLQQVEPLLWAPGLCLPYLFNPVSSVPFPLGDTLLLCRTLIYSLLDQIAPSPMENCTVLIESTGKPGAIYQKISYVPKRIWIFSKTLKVYVLILLLASASGSIENPHLPYSSVNGSAAESSAPSNRVAALQRRLATKLFHALVSTQNEFLMSYLVNELWKHCSDTCHLKKVKGPSTPVSLLGW